MNLPNSKNYDRVYYSMIHLLFDQKLVKYPHLGYQASIHQHIERIVKLTPKANKS